jgi:hypothetical protein
MRFGIGAATSTSNFWLVDLKWFADIPGSERSYMLFKVIFVPPNPGCNGRILTGTIVSKGRVGRTARVDAR